MKISGILETALYCEDLSAADAFYGGVLGLEKTDEISGRHVFYNCGDAKLLVFNPNETLKPVDLTSPIPVHGAVGQGHVCFRASNEEIDAWSQKLQAEGVEVEQDFRWPNGARSLYFRDPSGNSLEFAEPALWGLT